MGIQEGLWDCPNCEGTNRGSHIKCQGCGATREEDVEFYLPEEAVDILPDNPLYAMAEAGADWICPYCDTSNRATDPQCTNCGGAQKSEGSEREVKDVPDPAQAPPEPEPQGHPAAAAPESDSSGGKGCLMALAAFVVLFLAYGFYLTRTHEVTMKVAKSQWTRTIEVEKFGTYDEEAWQSQLPSGARKTSSARKIREYRKVLDHYENRTRTKTRKVKVGTEKYKCGKKNMGNGFFKDKYCTRDKYKNETYTERYKEPIYRKEPVYEQWVHYQIDRWKPTTPVSLTGTDHQPRWPPFTKTSTLREGGRSERYLIWVEDPENQKTHEFEVPGDRFGKFPPGTSVVGTVNNRGVLKEVGLPGEKKKD